MAGSLALLLFASQILGSLSLLKFAAYYGNHMVLQRGPETAVVWGHAAKIGDTVTVTVTRAGAASLTAHGQVTKDPHGPEGIWKVKLPPVVDASPHEVTAKSSEGTVAISDVLFGDVWLCSGQSNMGFQMQSLINSSAEIQRATQFPNVRHVRAANIQSNVPFTDLHGVTPWALPTAATVGSMSAVCWLFGEYLYQAIKRPIGLVETQWGGTPIESWSSPEASATCGSHAKRQTPSAGSVLWNSMINPFLPQTIYGAIWYQGESNAGRPDLYACQFPAMIADWRKKFHDASLGSTSLNFPFGFVQLAPNGANMNNIGGFPPLRWAQTAKTGQVPNAKMPNTFMAVALDLPDFNAPTGSIHPRYKQDVAHRLVLGARAVAYGDRTVTYQGPFPKSLLAGSNHLLTITYDHGPIVVHNNHGFEVCCSAAAGACAASDTWMAAPIVAHAINTVSLNVAACGVKHVTSARYEWRESPCLLHACAVYSQAGLPAPPFILPVA